MISGRQIRAARALLGWSGQELADKCSISLKTLRRYEPQNGIPAGNTKVLESIETVLEGCGIVFTGDPIKDPGVILIKETS
jgi:ribosome-binding protein aMBF1 (putative translation factor)